MFSVPVPLFCKEGLGEISIAKTATLNSNNINLRNLYKGIICH